MRALLSVYDKTGIEPLARELVERGWGLVSTGGTLASLTAAGIPVTAVADVTGFPEILDGRVKTLHPRIHGGLLARLDMPDHAAALAEHEIEPIGLVVCNLYPFEWTVRQPGISLLEALEQIDIGGPAMIRAAAKNFHHVTVLVSPDDFPPTLEDLAAGGPGLERRRELAAKAFAHVSAYDAVVAEYLRGDDTLPDIFTIAGRKTAELRYGENPHQRAAAYSRLVAGRPIAGLLTARQLHGKELSYNNLLDADAAWNALRRFDRPAASVIKHTIPCGLAVHGNLLTAFERAVAGDPVSAFGGIVALNRAVDVATAQRIGSTFFEVVIAPGYEPDALDLLQRKRQLRLLELSAADSASEPITFRAVSGGFLVQEPDNAIDDRANWTVVTTRRPSDTEHRDLAFAWDVCRSVKSNAIVLARDEAVVGTGSGQPNRLESVRIAASKAGERARHSVLASDAFFPFADGLEAAITAGITAAIQPGGSVRDQDVIDAANAAGIAMVFTGQRHFLH